jgi:uncharacterized protein YndB with AHSA1/START domain
VPTDSRGLTLHIERALPAPRPLVYRANTEPEELARWWGPRGFSAPRVEIDLRVGGRYRIAMQPPEGDLFHLSGEFREVEPGVRLAYTFRWEEPTPDDRETVVALSFEDMGGGASRLTVDQGDFATEERRSLHLQGWTETLDRLEEVVSGPEALGGD